MTHNYTEFDKAVLMEKAIILNAMLASNDKVVRQKALIEWKELVPTFETIIQPELQRSIPNIKEEPFF